MTPPEAPEDGPQAARGQTPPAVSVCLTTLTKRADFLRAARALRQGTPAMTLQARNRGDDSADVRVGYTCSKKVGNAVARNRAKRRLREIARLVLPAHARPGWDYVLIGRPEATATRDFALLQSDLIRALQQVHAKGAS